MSYFKTSYDTLQSLALHGRYDDLAGFLVLARHASGLSHAGFEPYKLSGAGVNGIHEKVGVSEEAARGVVQRLQACGLIRPASAETRKAFHHARWEIQQGKLDLDLPHAFVDNLKEGAESALRRFKKVHVQHGYKDRLSSIPDNDLRLDTAMLLLAAYKHTSMTQYGGIAPHCILREWKVESQTPKLGGVRWGVDPAPSETTYFVFMREALAHALPKTVKGGGVPDDVKHRFWNAWGNIKETGLVYEAVCHFNALPQPGKPGGLNITLRVNDYHAGAVQKSGDPSLLRSLESSSGSRFAFYTPQTNERDEPEAMWVVLPDKRGAIVGIWRPRFRCSNQDTGTWAKEENERIETIVQALEDGAPEEI